MDRPRLIRWLRICWIAFWGTLAVLLVVLWGRSYFARDSVLVVSEASWRYLTSARGEITFDRNVSEVSPTAQEFSFTSESGEDALSPVASLVPEKPPWSLIGIRFVWDRGDFVLCFPHWFGIAVGAALTALPSLRLARQFSIRTLLIAVTLVCVVLGLCVWSSRQVGYPPDVQELHVGPFPQPEYRGD